MKISLNLLLIILISFIISCNVKKAENKSDIKESIAFDTCIQRIANEKLQNAMKLYNCKQAFFVLKNEVSGKFIASVKLTVDSVAKYKESRNIFNDEEIPPGSIFIVPSIMVMLEDGFITIEDSVDTGDGEFIQDTIVIKDSRKNGTLTVKQIVEYGSNVGLAMLVKKNYSNDPFLFYKGLKNLGLSFRFDEEKPFSDTAKWIADNLYYLAIGYKIKMKYKEIFDFYSAISNYNKDIAHFSAKTNNNISKILKSVVERGSGKNFKNSQTEVAGKTGVSIFFNKKLNQTSCNLTFIGFFKVKSVTYTFYLMSESNDFSYGILSEFGRLENEIITEL